MTSEEKTRVLDAFAEVAVKIERIERPPGLENLITWIRDTSMGVSCVYKGENGQHSPPKSYELSYLIDDSLTVNLVAVERLKEQYGILVGRIHRGQLE